VTNPEARPRSLVPAGDWLSDEAGESLPGFAWLLLGVSILGAAIRLYRLDGQSLWVDEIMTWRQVRPGVGLEFWPQIRDAIQGPLDQAILWPIVRLHPGAFWMRLPSAVAGILTVPALGLCASRMGGRRLGLLAALLLAVNPFHVWYSQEIRGYALLMLFVVLAGWLVQDLGAGKGGWGHALVLALCGGLAMAANLSALFFWLALGVTWVSLPLSRGGRPHGPWLFALVLGLLLILPWLLRASGVWAVDRLLPGTETGQALRGASTFTWLAIPYTVFSFACGFSCGPSLTDLHLMSGSAVLASWFPVLGLVGLAVGVPLLRSLTWVLPKRWMLLVWSALPVLLLAVLAGKNIKPWNPRYLAAVLPWFLVMLGAGLLRLPRRVRPVWGVLLVGISLWSLGGYFWNPRFAREDIRAAAGYLQSRGLGAQPVVAPVVTSVLEYYFEDGIPVIGSYGCDLLDGPEAARQYMSANLTGADGAWLVWSRHWDFDPHGYLPEQLSLQGNLVREFSAAGVQVFHWQRRGAGSHEAK